MNTIICTHLPTEPKFIIELQEKFSCIFPDDYMAFLQKYNGGEPELRTFRCSVDDGTSLINEFYGIGDMDSNLEDVFEDLDGALPEGVIAIADDPGGNQICLGIRNDTFDKVYFWIHDLENNSNIENLFFLANTFDDFLNNLYE